MRKLNVMLPPLGLTLGLRVTGKMAMCEKEKSIPFLVGYGKKMGAGT